MTAIRTEGAVGSGAVRGSSGSADRSRATIPSGPLAPSVARNFVRAGLCGRVSDRMLDDALLAVSELVTNSVRHAATVAGAPVRVSVELTAAILRLEVRDTGQAGAVARSQRSADQVGGFGLQLVEDLAGRWGVDRSDGTLVWCELARA